MAKKKRPSVDKFREFVRDHPYIANEVRNKQATWQELFEEWYLLGEDHPRWQSDNNKAVEPESIERKEEPANSAEDAGTSSQSNPELIGSVINAVKNMDLTQMQQYISSANQAIGAIQGVLSAFQGNNSDRAKEKPQMETEQRPNPFVFNHKD